MENPPLGAVVEVFGAGIPKVDVPLLKPKKLDGVLVAAGAKFRDLTVDSVVGVSPGEKKAKDEDK
jgi:hypothetical protein